MNRREQILAATAGWVGTPYRHQGSLKGIGCDCLGMVLGVWAEVYDAVPEEVAPYPRDWASGGREILLDAARRHCREKPAAAMRPGDLMLLRWRRALPAAHCAILSAPDRIIHAYQGSAVVETALPPQWRRRLAGVFAFPETE